MVRRFLASALLACTLAGLAAFGAHDVISGIGKTPPSDDALDISPMGRIARGDDPRPEPASPGGMPPLAHAPLRNLLGAGGTDRLVHSATAGDFQSETSIAKNGDWIVAGFNDTRGFAFSPARVSGWAYSHDNGVTWTDGGQLPNLGPGDAVYGDPDVKTWTSGGGTRYFVYSSLYVTTNGFSSLCVHVSTDGGVTWTAPRTVTPATSTSDFADKEFIDIDPETGRLFISWTHFPNVGTRSIRTCYSDDFGLTWSPAVAFTSSSGQGSIPRAAGNSTNVYIAWTTGSTIQFVRSTNNGVSWSAPVSIATGLAVPMNPYGSDRINNMPAMDVDPNNGNVYVVYASRNLAPDFADIYFRRSVDGGLTFSAALAINSSPGSDRAQFFPSICADENDGSVSAIWYDQRAGTGTSDLTDVVHTHSVDGGLSWSCPAALTDQPFHAESGNTTSQPNIGDYNQCVSVDGTLYTSFGKTGPPTWLTYSPDTYVDVSGGTGAGAAPLVISGHALADTGCTSNNGFIEAGETIELTIEIRNAGGCGGVGNVSATLSTATPGVTVTTAGATFPAVGGLDATSVNSTPFVFTVDPSVECGTQIDFTVDYVTDLFGPGSLPFEGRLWVGHPVETVLLSENFDGVTAPALPAGWTTATLAGAANPWVTSTVYAASGLNSAYCADITVTSHNEMKSPAIPIPAGTKMVRVDLDETHNIELLAERQAWDGGLMRIQRGTARYFAGAVGVMEPFYPWQILRGSSSTQPLQDLACWSGNTTPNFAHYVLDMPDLGGETITLCFSMSTDPSDGTPSGLFVDNVVVTAVSYGCDCSDPTGAGAAPLAFSDVSVVPNPFNPETAIRFTLPSRAAVTAEVWSVDGRRVRTLAANRAFDAGAAELRWNGTDEHGVPVASGIYFVRVKSPLGEHTARAVLLK